MFPPCLLFSLVLGRRENWFYTSRCKQHVLTAMSDECEEHVREEDASFHNTSLENLAVEFVLISFLSLSFFFFPVFITFPFRPTLRLWKAQGSLVCFTKISWCRKLQIFYIGHRGTYKKQRNIRGNLSIHLRKHLQDSFEGRWTNKTQQSSHQESVLFY